MGLERKLSAYRVPFSKYSLLTELTTKSTEHIHSPQRGNHIRITCI